MPERFFVEISFLTQLSELGWMVIDQGEGLPYNPGKASGRAFVRCS